MLYTACKAHLFQCYVWRQPQACNASYILGPYYDHKVFSFSFRKKNILSEILPGLPKYMHKADSWTAGHKLSLD